MTIFHGIRYLIGMSHSSLRCFCFSNCVLMALLVLITPISEAVKSNMLLRGWKIIHICILNCCLLDAFTL